MRHIKLTPNLMLLLPLLAACSTTGLVEQVKRDSASEFDRAVEQRAQQIPPADSAKSVRYRGGIWLGDKADTIKSDESLPSLFKIKISYNDCCTLNEIVEGISKKSGIRILITRDAQDFLAGRLTQASTSAMATTASSTLSQPPPTLPGSTVGGVSPSGPANPVMVNYSGTIDGLLDNLTSKLGLSWKYSDGVVKIYYLDTRTFTLYGVLADSQVKANVGGATGGSTATSSSTSTSSSSASSSVSSQTTQVSSSSSIMTSAENAIKAMLSPLGQVFVSPATGTVVVTDTAQVLDVVESYINSENNTMTKQVAIQVDVLSVTQSGDQQLGIDWSLVYETLKKSITVSSLFPTANANTLAASIIDTNSHWNGSQVLLKALETQGRVSLQTSSSVTTLNNQPVPVQVATQVGFIESITTTVTPNVGTSTQIVPGKITSGFSMNLLPHVLPNDDILLQFAIDLSSSLKIKSITSGNATVQIPEIDVRNFLQRVSLRSGQTLVLSGFEQTSNNIESSGTLSPDNWLLGGGNRANRKRDILVVTITPVIIDKLSSASR